MVVVINPDKTISINGVKTFIVGLGDVGSETRPEPDLSKYKDFEHVSYTGGTAYLRTVIPEYNRVGLRFILSGRNIATSLDIQAELGFIGYFNCDEPISKLTQSLYSTTKTQDQCLALKRCSNRVQYEWREPNECWYPDEEPQVSIQHNAFKTGDPGHLSILGHWRDMNYWYKYSDMMTWGIYAVRRVSGMDTYYTREDAMYAWEILSEQNFFKGTSLDDVPVSVIATIQALGYDYPDGRMQALTPAEARCNTYLAVCMNVKGIRFWTNHFTHPTGPTEIGLSANPTLFAYYSQIAREIRGLDDALVSPTIAYKWYARGLNPTTVTFSKNYIKTVLNKSVGNWSYILKQGLNSLWLIVVNKDALPISDVTISISGLTGGSTATIRGLETVGSGAAGRTVPVTNGQFTDSFDGQAVHVYDIPQEGSCPQSSLTMEII